MMTKLGQALLDLGAKRAGILLLIAALSIGWGARSVAYRFLGGFGSYDARITSLERWRVTHVRDVEGPGIAKIESLDLSLARQDTLLRNVENMVYRLYCDRWPEQCEGHPIRNGGQ